MDPQAYPATVMPLWVWQDMFPDPSPEFAAWRRKMVRDACERYYAAGLAGCPCVLEWQRELESQDPPS